MPLTNVVRITEYSFKHYVSYTANILWSHYAVQLDIYGNEAYHEKQPPTLSKCMVNPSQGVHANNPWSFTTFPNISKFLNILKHPFDQYQACLFVNAFFTVNSKWTM